MKREKFIQEARREGKTERVRKAVRDAIERGDKIYIPNTASIASDDGDDADKYEGTNDQRRNR